MAKLTKTQEVEKLSPASNTRLTSLSDDPTKSGISDYDRALQSTESSVRKALVALNKIIAATQQAREREAAQKERAKELRQQKIRETSQQIAKAREEGKALADQADADAEGDKGQAGDGDGDAGDQLPDAAEAEDPPCRLLADSSLLADEPSGGLPDLTEGVFDIESADHPCVKLMQRHRARGHPFRQSQPADALQHKLDGRTLKDLLPDCALNMKKLLSEDVRRVLNLRLDECLSLSVSM